MVKVNKGDWDRSMGFNEDIDFRVNSNFLVPFFLKKQPIKKSGLD